MAVTQWPPPAVVCALAVPLIARFEGFAACPYVDSAGVWTIGFGTTHYPCGRQVTAADQPCTREEARAWLVHALGAIRDALRDCLIRCPSAHQAAALSSLTYNVGLSAIGHSTLVAKFNRGDVAGAAAQFLCWDKAHVDGRVMALPGLAARRAAERVLFLTPDARIS